MSLSDRNVIQVGSSKVELDKYEHNIIPPGQDLRPGQVIEGRGPFTVGVEGEAVDSPVPGVFAGTLFVIPHIRNSHLLSLLSPDEDATVTIESGGVSTTVALIKGVVSEYSSGSDNTVSTLVESDTAIFVNHVAVSGSTKLDAFPVSPASKELWGVKSKNALLGVSADNTTVTVFSSGGESQSLLLNRGARQVIAAGLGNPEGAGEALHVVADKPISVVQFADSDGSEATSFLPTHLLSNIFGIPLDAQYLAIACARQNTRVTLYDGTNNPITQVCNGVPENYPGKLLFGSTQDGLNIGRGAYLESSNPIYVYYESSVGNEEKQLIGYKDSYAILNPWTAEGPLSVVSLSDGNTIRSGTTNLQLNKNQLGVIPAGASLSPGTIVSGTGAFELASEVDGSDIPTPISFSGTEFAIPHLRGHHIYDFFSPVGDAVVEVNLDETIHIVNLTEGHVSSFNAGSNNSIASVISSTHPILVHHRAQSALGSGSRMDSFPVSPAANEFWGVRSQSLFVVGVRDATSVLVYADTGETEEIYLQKGEVMPVNIGLTDIRGVGSAVHIIADKPINAIRYDDADGLEATTLLSKDTLGTYYALPVDAQYLSIVCVQPDTRIVLNDTANNPVVKMCSSEGEFPGKAYFGLPQLTTDIPKGSYIESNNPIQLYFESVATEDESNIFGLLTAPQNQPISNFVATPNQGSAPLTVFFDGATSTSSGLITEYLWDFGDGSVENGPAVSHTYDSSGIFEVKLTITDSLGLTSQTHASVNVLPQDRAELVMEVGVIDNVDGDWKIISLQNNYDSMVVVATVVLPSQSSLPAVPRIRNATGTQFEIKLQNPSGSLLSGYEVHYFAVEEGIYNSTDHGVNLEASFVNSTITAGRNNWIRQQQNFYNSYIAPVVVGQVVSQNDTNWSVFWASSSTSAISAPQGSSFSAGKHIAEDTSMLRLDEKIGYIVAESGVYNIDGLEFLAGVGEDSVGGVGSNPDGYSYLLSGLASPKVAVLSSAGMDGNDGGWPVLYGREPVTQQVIQLAIEEDQIVDAEISHTTEQVAYFVFSQTTELNNPPNAQFTFDPASGSVPLTVHFDAISSSDSDGVISSFTWDFGDGDSGIGISTSHEYTAPGSYSASLTVMDNDGAIDQATATTFVQPVNSPPKSVIAIDSDFGHVPLTIHVDGHSSSDIDGTITNFSWEFGDGEALSEASGDHIFTVPGSYIVVLTVTDNNGASDVSSKIVTVNVPNIPPVANFATNLDAGKSPFDFTVDGSGSFDNDGEIVSYFWDFGDGTTGNNITETHQYLLTGNYNVTLTILDDDGLSAQSSKLVRVLPANTAPVSSFIASPESGQVSLIVNFDGSNSLDSDGVINTYFWEYGDGTTGSGIISSHEYDVVGNYRVTLTVTDIEGLSGQFSSEVVILPVSHERVLMESGVVTNVNDNW